MNDYNKESWLKYKKGKLLEEEVRRMDEHLLKCDQCLEIFLSLVDTKEIEKAREIIPADFTKNIMHEISGEKKKRNNIFTYYVAVAAVAIFLTGTGFFQSLAYTVPIFEQQAEQRHINSEVNVIRDISEKVVTKTSDFIYSFETNDKGDLR